MILWREKKERNCYACPETPQSVCHSSERESFTKSTIYLLL